MADLLLLLPPSFLSQRATLTRIRTRSPARFLRRFAGAIGFSRIPLMRAHVHFHAGELGSFGFKQHALFAGVRLAREEPSARTDHAVPRNALSRRSARHGKANGARAAGDFEQARQLAIRDHTPARYPLDRIVDSLPAACVFRAHLKITLVLALSSLVLQKYTLPIVFSWYENGQNVSENILLGTPPPHLASNKEKGVVHHARSAEKPDSAPATNPS